MSAKRLLKNLTYYPAKWTCRGKVIYPHRFTFISTKSNIKRVRQWCAEKAGLTILLQDPTRNAYLVETEEDGMAMLFKLTWGGKCDPE